MRNTHVAVITGAGSTIGKSIALELARRDYTLILTSKDARKLKSTAYEIAQAVPAASPVITLPADLSTLADIEKLTARIKAATTRVDVLVNAAGVYHDERKAFSGIDYADYTPAQILTTLSVGLTAPLLLTHALLPLMPESSRIVNISGTFETGAKGWLPYYVSKKALEDLTVGLSQEVKDKKILVNCISPSDTLTDSYKKFFPQYAKEGECLPAESVAEMVGYLTSTGANYLTGQIIEMRQLRVGS